ncbi:extracellular solute-binding protein [Halothermothrix orenii]|uniref:Extracellular solute-binding protein family 1 n=1 Tax=Halothermothrix orenii (strain H 168 / OCM 544 / DSM 9562) TaxID=373903 RepID=B8D1V8_HALOH|nr:extracellular solute-binding protein [Halothermothrix orenii]ACL69185.1 extracellular solute-binding protein family 1 [Halothermothrix orenii H 168]
MKKFAVIAVVALLVVSMFSLSIAAKTKIKVACFPDQDSGFEAILDQFHAEHPDIEVELVVNGFADHHNTLLTQIAAGAEVPDVAMIEIGYIANFVSKGGFVNLLEEPYNAGQFKENIVPYKWAQGSTDDGRLIAFPTDIAPGTIYYRRDKLAELGYEIEDMKTLEDWIEAGSQFAKDLDGDGVNDRWLLADATDIFFMIAKSGEELYFNEDGECIVDSPRFIKAFKAAKMVRDMGLDARIGAWTNEWYSTFKDGTVLMQPSGAWLGGHIRNWIAPDTAGKWGVTNLPDGMYCNWGGSFAAIPEKAEHKEEAWEFIKFIATRKDTQIAQFKASNIFPAWMPAFDDPVFQEEMEFYGGQKARLLWLEAAKKIPNVVTNKYDVIAEEIVTAALTDVLNNDADPVEALREAKRMIERRMRRR